MKKSIANGHFQVDFHPDGSAKPFFALAFKNKARRDRVRRALFPADRLAGVKPIDISHLRSQFQVWEDQRPDAPIYRDLPAGSCRISQDWSAEPDSISVTARLRLTKGLPARGVHVRWTFPHPYLPEDGIGNGYSLWRVWAAHLDAPFSDDWGHLTFTHGRCPDVSTEIVLPAVTLFQKEADTGFTFFLDQEVPWITRIELDQRRRLLAFDFFHVGLRPGQTTEIALRIFSHAGCWRAGLGALQKRFPAAFAPHSDRARTFEGPMAYTLPSNPRALRTWRKTMGLSFNEILHFNDFGQYAPREPWNCRNFWSKEAPWRKIDGLTWARLRDYVRKAQDLGVGTFLYINFADCESRLAKRRFARAIARNEWGREMVTWVYPDRRRYTLMMNPDPEFGFSSAILEQAEEILHRVPEIDGFHLDQNAYGWIDTAHDDGVTMLNDQPAYNMLRGYRRAGRAFRELCNRHGKLIESNGIIHFRQLEDVDMLMAEQSLPTLARYGPICSQRALFYLATGEQGCQWSLKYGAFPHVSPYEWAPGPDFTVDRKTASIYQAYEPVAALLRGAAWVLEPHCLQLPQQQRTENSLGNITGNLFRRPDGSYLATLLQAPPSVLNTGPDTEEFPAWNLSMASFGLHQETIGKGFPVILRFSAARSIRTVQFLQPHRRPVRLPWRRSGKTLEIQVPRLGAFAALHLLP